MDIHRIITFNKTKKFSENKNLQSSKGHTPTLRVGAEPRVNVNELFDKILHIEYITYY